jgi:DNA primase
MSTDRISVAVVEEFIKKVRLAAKSGQKEIKISVSEAENVVHNLNLITLKLLERDQTTKSTAENDIINVVMDGGGFEENR